MVSILTDFTFVNAGISGLINFSCTRTVDEVGVLIGGGSAAFETDIFQVNNGEGTKTFWVGADGSPRKASGIADGDTLLSQDDIDGYLEEPAFAEFGTTADTVAAGDDDRFWVPALGGFREWASAGSSGFTTSVSGTGLTYLVNPRFFSYLQSDDFVSGWVVETGTSTSGTNAAQIVSSNYTAYAVAGRKFRIRFGTFGLSTILSFRIGFFGDHSSPGITAQPASGFWIEFDASIDGANIYLAAGDGTTRSSSISTVTLNDTATTLVTFVLEYVSTSSVKLYTVANGVSTLVASHGTNIPSDEQGRSLKFFAQINKDNTGGAGRGQAHFEFPGVTFDGAGREVLVP